VLTDLQTERDALTDAPVQLSALQTALQEYGSIQGQRNAKQSECDRLPAEHQVPIAEAEADAQAHNAAAEAATREARLADSRATLIDERFAQKVQVEEEREIAAERQRLFRKLATLLGKTGLQGVLVTEALTIITSHANSFLQRLTGGSLQLELAKSDASDELEIKAIDTTSMRESRNIQALSGSQKFRCAVALAFGIGQYTGAGGMRSMMIDEGFGGLDEAGQQQMVAELRHLATYMDKVIVVSHLEAFRDRDNFPCQIHVTKDGSRSLISNHRY
jgi:exonuclease SbcC